MRSKGDVLVVVAALGLGGWREDGRLQLLALLQAGGERFPGQRPVVPVLPPGRAREEAADNALYQDRACAADQHGATGPLGP